MRPLHLVSLFAMAFLAAPIAARAQDLNFAALHEGTNVVTVQTGEEYGLVLGAGYAGVVSLAARPLVLGADLTLGWADLDVDDFRLRASALAPLVNGRRWKVIGGFAASLRGTENDLSRMTNVGADFAVLAGRYAPRGFIAAELGVDWAFARHVDHGDTTAWSTPTRAMAGTATLALWCAPGSRAASRWAVTTSSCARAASSMQRASQRCFRSMAR